MIWILRDDDEQIGLHYDLGKLLQYCSAHEPNGEYHLEICYDDTITETLIDNISI